MEQEDEDKERTKYTMEQEDQDKVLNKIKIRY